MSLIFEQSTSNLYYSDDARLHLTSCQDDEGRKVWQVVRIPDAPVVEIEYGTAVLTTLDRTLADAYIAGYDLATSQYNR